MRLNLIVSTGTLLAFFRRLRRVLVGRPHWRVLLPVLLLLSAAAPAHGSDIPTDLVATLGEDGVSLTWSAPTTNAATVTGYQVLRRHLGTDAAGVFNEIGTTGASQTTYTDLSVTGGASYVYRVKARRGDRLSGFSNFTRIDVPPLPSQPSGLRAAAGHRSVTLSWNDPNNGTITGYEYRYRTGRTWSEWTAIDPSDAKTTSHRVTGLVNGRLHTFQVRAKNAGGPGASASLPARPVGYPPTNLTVALVAGSVTLSWGAPAADAGFVTGYEVLRRRPKVDGAGVFHAIATTGGSETTYVDGGVEGGEKYVYRVKARRGTDLSLWSNSVNIVAPSVPSAPGNLSAAVGGGSVTLSWDDPDDDITGYQVRYARNGTSLPGWSNVQGSDANTTSHTVSRLTNCTEYTFEVRARAADLASASSSVKATPSAGDTAGPVTALGATAGDGQVTLSWTNPGGATTNEIRYAKAGASLPSTWTSIGVKTSHTVEDLDNCDEYTFEVRALYCGGSGTPPQVKATPSADTAGPVTGLSTTAGDGQVALSWTNPGGTAKNEIRYAKAGTSLPSTWTDIGVKTSHTVEDLDNCDEYTFEVRAFYCGGSGTAPQTKATPSSGSAPGSVTGLSTTAGDGQVTLSWTNPGGTITNNQIRYVKAGTQFLPVMWTDIGVKTSHTVEDLDNCDEYLFQVRAVNCVGDGVSSGEGATPSAAHTAGPVTSLSGTAGDGQVALSWTNPGGTTKNEIRYAKAGTSLPSSWTDIGVKTSHTVEDLDNCDEYTFEVRAFYCGGSGTAPQTKATPTSGTAPGSVTGLSTTAGDGQVTLSWTNPGGTITNNQIRYVKVGTQFLPVMWTDIGVKTSHTVEDLDNCDEYLFQVRAINCVGDGVSSGEGATPSADTAGPVTSLSGTAGDGQVELSWTNPGGTTKNEIRYAKAGTPLPVTWTDIGVKTSHTVEDLDNCDEYAFEVRAFYCDGSGTPPQTKATPSAGDTAGPVTSLSTTAGDGQVELSWTNPGGTTKNEIRYAKAGTSLPTTWTSIGVKTSHTVEDLDNCDEYTFEVRALYCGGSGTPPQTKATPTAGNTAGPVTGLSTTAGDGQVALSWTNPGGTTTNEIRYAKAGMPLPSTWTDIGVKTSHTVENLDNCDEYTFEVRAFYCDGSGTPPQTKATPTAGDTAGPVTSLSTTAGDGQVELRWTNPGGTTTNEIRYAKAGTPLPSAWTDIGVKTSHTVENLDNCDEYTFEARAFYCGGSGPPPQTKATPSSGSAPAPVIGVSVTGTGDGTVSLSWDSSSDATVTGYKITYSGATSGTVEVAGGTTTTQDVTGLTNCEEYTFEVLAFNCVGDGTPSSSVTGTPGAAPAQATGVSVTDTDDGTVSLSWDRSGDATVTGYKISYSGATSGTINVAGGATTTQDVTGLTNCEEYTFEVLAVNCKGDGAASTSVTGTPSAGGTAGPVTSLSATAGDGQVELSWTNPDGTTKNEIRYAKKGTSLPTTWTDISVKTSHTVENLDNCDEYTFEVRALYCGASGTPPQTKATPSSGSAPGSVTRLSATKGNGQVTLSWTNPSGTITNNQIRYAKAGTSLPSTWTSIGVKTSHTVEDLDNCDEYTFEVRAINCDGNGDAASDNATPSSGSAPGSVTGLDATKGNGQVTLSWTNPSGTITNNQIRYAKKGTSLPSTWTSIGVKTSHTVEDLDNCDEYAFEVRAVNCDGNGGADSEKATPSSGSAPGSVTGLEATKGNGQVTLSWTNPGGTITNNQIRYAKKGTSLPSTWTSIGVKTSHTVEDLDNCDEYTFEVRAVNCDGNGGADSEKATPSSGSAPGSVTGLGATKGNGQVTLSWTNPSGTITNNQIRYAKAGTSLPTTWTDIGVKTSHTVEDLDNCDEYTFEVRAVNCDGNGDADSDKATPSSGSAPGSVTRLSATKGNGQVTLGWTNPSGTITNNQVRYALTDGDINEARWKNVGVKTSHTVENLTNCKEYTFQVRAVNCDGNGGADSDKATPSSGSPPGAVTNLTGTGGNTQVRLTWTNPVGTITHVHFRYAPKGTTRWSSWARTDAATSHTVTGLTNCTEYTFEVCAINCDGPGPAGSENATPSSGSAPGAVTGLDASKGNGELELSWTNPSGTITDNQIRYARTGTPLPTTWTNIGVKTSHTLDNLTNCNEYTFEVRAVNCDGNGGADSEKATPVGVPGQVTSLSAAKGDGQVTLSWGAPSGSCGITGYEITVGDRTLTTTGTSITVDNLTNCTEYTFSVLAKTMISTGASKSVTQTPVPVPGQVTNLSKVESDGKVTLSWGAPSGSCGITGYEIAAGDRTLTTTGTSITVDNLTNCTEYTFSVLAKTMISDGASRSIKGTPGVKPAKVTGAVVKSVGDGTVTLSWDDPNDDTVTEYKIVYVGGSFGTVNGIKKTEHPVPDLTNCRAYSFQVHAVNCKGSGLASDIVSGTPGIPPGIVRNLVATEGDKQVTLNWDAPNSGCSTSQYEVKVGTNTYSVTGTSYTVKNLRNCNEYGFGVRAQNTFGNGPMKSVTGTPHAPFSVSSISDRAGTKGRAISSFRVGTSGGCSPYSYSLSPDPPEGSGLSVSSSGSISGTPTAKKSFEIEVAVEDNIENSDTTSFTFTVADPVVIASISDITEIPSVPFTHQVKVSGGRTPYRYSISVTPTLPSGSSLSISSSGLIEGEITGLGTYSVTVTVSDADNRTDTEEFDVAIQGPGDFNGDGRRDAADAEMLNKKSGLRSSDAGYDRRMDLNGDGVINFADLVILSGYIQKDASSQSDSESNDESE